MIRSFILLFFTAVLGVRGVDAQAQQTLAGIVLDASSGAPIALANIVVDNGAVGTASGDDGTFRIRLEDGHHALRISALGFETQLLAVHMPAAAHDSLRIALTPVIVLFQEVMVSGVAPKSDELTAPVAYIDATEDLVDRIPGADFIQRANFAWEPVIRGMNGGQVALVIDGIKVVGACIDKMDPTSAYVEVENLEKLELSKGGFDLSQGSQIGGTVNLVTEKPSFTRPFFADAEFGYESAAALRRVRFAGGASHRKTSVRASFSYKSANDFSPGGRAPVANSGFTKNNYKIDVAQKVGATHQFTASMLADNAWHVGYPVLLMDATLAEARIYSLTHNWAPAAPDGYIQSWETRVYYNTVDHWMDDYRRDVTQRSVMRSMNMPMYGLTRTAGGMSTVRASKGAHRVGLTLDATQTLSFGEMWMFSVLPNIPDMYLLNLGDVLIRQAAAAVDYSATPAPRLKLRMNARYDYSWRDVQREEARAILQGRWGDLPLARSYAIPGVSVTLEYTLAERTLLRLAAANVARLPTHVENYGHYIYNYVDGYFYTGNPGLKPERSRQVELGFERLGNRFGLRLNAFYNYVDQYILGHPDTGLVGGGNTYRFRVFTNIEGATLSGGELSAVLDLGYGFEWTGAASYTRGWNIEDDEPLPLIPPLFSTSSVTYNHRKGWGGEIELRAAAPQNKVARKVAEEDGTDGYFVVNLRTHLPIGERTEIKAGVENVFDYYYHEHLSFGNLPNLGRNVYLALGLRW
ncbi:MAG: TonB-dependent receptor [Rhodothermales bacterium]